MTTLYSFTNGHCYNPLVLATDGNFYGAAGETVFRMTTNGVVSTVTEVLSRSKRPAPGQRRQSRFHDNCLGAIAIGRRRGVSLNNQWRPDQCLLIPQYFQLAGRLQFTSRVDARPRWKLLWDHIRGRLLRLRWNFPHCHGAQLPIHQPIRSQISLTWSLMPGQNYQMQSTASLSAPDWLNVGAHSRAATTIVTNSDNLGTNTQRFYRLSIAQ